MGFSLVDSEIFIIYKHFDCDQLLTIATEFNQL